MKNFSINASGVQNNKKTDKPVSDNYSKLEKEYKQEMGKLSKSDFANSPVAIEKELSFISKLKAVAIQQGLDSQLKSLQEREQALYTKLANSSVSLSNNSYYSPISFKGRPSISGENQLDYTQDRFLKFLSQGFENEDLVKSNLQIMSNVGINTNSAISILNVIKTKNPETGLYQINQDTFEQLTTIKTILATSRNNEKKEHYSPINQIGVDTFSDGKNTIIFRNGKAVYITPVEEKSVQCMRDEYEQAVSEEEDKMLYDFVLKYADTNGKINDSYIRILSHLRQVGVARKELFDLLDRCVAKNGAINKNVFDTIAQLKKGGVLSSDIEPMLASFSVDDDGNFDKEDVTNAIALTENIMTGKDVISFLPAIKTGEEAKSFIINFSAMLGTEKTRELLKLVSDTQGIPDEDSMDIVRSLLHNNLFMDKNNMPDKKTFVDVSRYMITLAKDFGLSQKVNDDAANLIFEMCRQSLPLEDIEKILNKCIDENGKIDNTLVRIAWNMAWDEIPVGEIADLLDGCKTNDGINREKAQKILAQLEEDS